MMPLCDLELLFDLALPCLCSISKTIRCRKLLLGRYIGWRV